MAWIWITLAFALIAHFVLRALLWKTRSKKRLPPGPRGFPILGNLPWLGQNPHHDLHKLAQNYGPLMYLRLGFVPTIVISSPEVAEQFLKTHDLVFASRPPNEASKHISYEQRSLAFAPYGPYWRNIRKMCTLELLSNAKVNSFKSMRREEVGLFVSFLKDASHNHTAIDLSAKISSLSADMSCRMVFGKKYMDKEFDERGFKAVIQEGMVLAAIPNIGDYVPYLASFDLQGLTKRMKAVSKVFDAFFEKIIDEHLKSKKEEGESKDFVDVMLGFMGSNEGEYHIDRPHIKAVILDMLSGSMDTSATAIEWAIAELIKHPNAMRKLQDELERAVGLNRAVEESDVEGLDYLDMVIKETMRLHPVAPLLLPHEATEDCTVNGFHIPRKSRVIVNVWSIGRDPKVWTTHDPKEFVPKRFLGSSVDVKGRDFQLLPFGAGRRGCPGMQLGLTVVRFVLAQLVHCFDWDLPGGMLPSELDMTEEFGLTTPRAKHLVVTPRYRLHE
ncbi:cytochrome P450 71AU50-like [Syzygium oleosum]|uniref:cytochrome P450 71AU50-like n=1 Tax=Syzygium oleosum TaxID=219896 RepID=UPI0011D2213F|nr:cytochrome P450 71AU50-like [Syzygium oleosum]XP_056159089.1 cytochrome P450 71AU50-like [Syzygium oleosum]XP_056159090.1 cytochrome P450 71AU50-like [Syzygium oleosum]XP_056163619.1 cytochrome P450 71AU50-like [Syzygium oleosum]